MKQIAILANNNIFVTLGDIATFSGNDIRYTKELILKYSEDFKIIGLDISSVNFKGLKPLRLTETQTNFLLMLMRNSENVVKFKLALSVQIEKLKVENDIYHRSLLEAKEKQLQISQKETVDAKRKAYAHTRAGNYQCISNIIRDTNANISPETFNKILLDKKYIKQKEVKIKKYIGNEKESTTSLDGTVLIHYDTAISILKHYEVEFTEDDQMLIKF